MKSTPAPKTAKVWLFDPVRMTLGDIVLERAAGISSSAVAAATGGPFSHALIWVGSDFVEAMPGGVRNLSFARVPVTDPPNWALLRAKAEQQPIAALAAVEARRMVFENYDLAGAALTQFGGRRSALSGARFCSQLIAEAYRRAGLDLVPSRRPEQVTPNMLLKAVSHDRTGLPLIDATEFNAGEPYPNDMLDRSSAFQSAPMQREGDVNREIFKSVGDLVRVAPWPVGRSVGPPGSLNEVIDLLALLPPEHGKRMADRLLAAMERTGYFTLLVPVLADLWPRVGAGHRPHIAGWTETRDRYQQNFKACRDRREVMSHPIWDRLANMYLMNSEAFNGLIEKASRE